MTYEDFAVVVGINSYPNLTSLKGAENDANNFEQWLVKPSGGGLDLKNVNKILSSAKGGKLEPNPLTIEDAFDPFVLRSKTDVNQKAGRRLYIYFSGHGLGLPQEPDEALLLTADAHSDALGKHIAGKVYANAISTSPLFEEVILIMDCCREVPYKLVNKRPFPYQLANGGPAKLFTAFASQWSTVTREKEENNVWFGVFSKALLSGLNAGRMTGSELKNYIVNYLPSIVDPGQYVEPYISDSNLIFSETANPPNIQAIFHFPGEFAGAKFSVEGSNLVTPIETHVPTVPTPNGLPTSSMSLRPGLYITRIESPNPRSFGAQIVGGPILNLEIKEREWRPL